MQMSDWTKQTFVDLEKVTRKKYYDDKKLAVASAKDCFVLRGPQFDVLYTKDGEDYYAGKLMVRIDEEKFEDIHVVRTRDIYRIYIDRPVQEAADEVTAEVAEDEPVTV